MPCQPPCKACKSTPGELVAKAAGCMRVRRLAVGDTNAGALLPAPATLIVKRLEPKRALSKAAFFRLKSAGRALREAEHKLSGEQMEREFRLHANGGVPRCLAFTQPVVAVFRCGQVRYSVQLDGGKDLLQMMKEGLTDDERDAAVGGLLAALVELEDAVRRGTLGGCSVWPSRVHGCTCVPPSLVCAPLQLVPSPPTR